MAQVILVTGGTLRVQSAGNAWLVPTGRALWLPAGEAQTITAPALSTVALQFAPEVTPELTADLPAQSLALAVSPLLRELVLELARRCPIAEDDHTSRHFAHAAIDCVARAEPLPLSVPLPRDPRAMRLAKLLQADPAMSTDLTTLARQCGASPRTLQRLFLRQTGLPFRQWRQRLRLIHGPGLLSEGASVTEAGLAAGYAGTSAFIAAFGRHFGMTPGEFGRG
ncbi:MAG: AraC family transcriptional regulator [Alteraurantiacibacter sp.]